MNSTHNISKVYHGKWRIPTHNQSGEVEYKECMGTLTYDGENIRLVVYPELIPPSLPSIIRNTDWSILWNKNDWILHYFERHFSNITNRHSFPFNTDCLPEYQTSPLTNSPPEQSSHNASQQVITTNKNGHLIAQMSFF